MLSPLRFDETLPARLETTEMIHNTLNIDPERFLDAYNLDIEDYIERHTFKESSQKGGKEIMYMSYSHAYRLFRQHFPELEVGLVENPQTGGFIWKEVDNRGYFLKPYVYQKAVNQFGLRSAVYYYPILSVSGQSVYPDELETVKDYNTKETKEKPGRYVANIQLFNKSNQRAIVKAIALTTGIGLKLWTGDDLTEDLLDDKVRLLEKVRVRADEYTALTGIPYTVTSSYIDTKSVITIEGKKLAHLIKEASPITVSVPEVTGATTEPVITEVSTKAKSKTAKTPE
jgi:hypothetical protein